MAGRLWLLKTRSARAITGSAELGQKTESHGSKEVDGYAPRNKDAWSLAGEPQDGLNDGLTIAAPPEVVGAFERVPHCAGNLLGQMLAGFKANRSITAPMHHQCRRCDAAQIGAHVGVTQAAKNRFEPSGRSRMPNDASPPRAQRGIVPFTQHSHTCRARSPGCAS